MDLVKAQSTQELTDAQARIVAHFVGAREVGDGLGLATNLPTHMWESYKTRGLSYVQRTFDPDSYRSWGQTFRSSLSRIEHYDVNATELKERQAYAENYAENILGYQNRHIAKNISEYVGRKYTWSGGKRKR